MTNMLKRVAPNALLLMGSRLVAVVIELPPEGVEMRKGDGTIPGE